MSDSPELPVAALDLSNLDNPPQETLVHADDAVLFQEEKGDELVKKSDAEEAREEARQAERQKILDKIKDKRAEFNNGRTSEYPQKVLTELLKEVETA